MTTISPCLWYDGVAEAAAEFYTSIIPDSRIDAVVRSPADNPSTPAGAVLTVEFTLAGKPYIALNGGPGYAFSEAISFSIECRDQAEVDRYWDALVESGGTHGPCGWLKDRFGVSWQVVPAEMAQLMNGPDRAGAARAMTAMLAMTQARHRCAASGLRRHRRLSLAAVPGDGPDTAPRAAYSSPDRSTPVPEETTR